MTVRETLAAALARAVEAARQSGELATEEAAAIEVDVPPTPELGDFTSGVAVTLARQSQLSPARAAELLAARLELPAGLLERVEVARSGFLNFYLKPDWLYAAVRAAREQRERFGRSEEPGRGSSAQVEFVSANPTGPLTVTHGRGAALGDALANLLEWSGYRVAREFYVNDASGLMERFGRSLEARYLQAVGQAEARVPLDGYQDAYLIDLAEAIRGEAGEEYASLPPEERLAAVVRCGRDLVTRRQRETLAAFGVRFDEWYSERGLHESGKVDEVLGRLRDAGLAYEREGALWLGSTRFGDEQDRPLRRSNGRVTYLAGDLAYHLDKFRRGFDRVIDVWGAEHQGYVGRTRAGMEALGCRRDALEIVIFAPVTPKVDGMVVEAPGQQGNNLTLEEVLADIGPDMARFFYLMRPAGTALDLDLDLARKETEENPLRQVWSACARAAAAGGSPAPDETDLSILDHPAETALARRLSDFPDEVRAAARELDPHRLTRYAGETAAAFAAFSRDCPPGDGARGTARVALADAAAVVLRNTLAVLGIPAPDGREEINPASAYPEL
jgi:arginyl-tRNA synthetase